MTSTVLATRAEAVALTKRIKAGLDRMDRVAEEILPLLQQAKETEVWRAFGTYTTWEEYVTTELGISRRRSYQLLDQAHAQDVLSAAVGEPIRVTERSIRPIKAHLTATGALAKKHRDAGMQPQLAVDTAVAEVRETITRSPIRDGGHVDFDRYDDGSMVLRCKSCNHVGMLGARFEIMRMGSIPGAVDVDDDIVREAFVD